MFDRPPPSISQFLPLTPAYQREIEQLSNSFNPKNNFPDVSIVAQLVLMGYVAEEQFYELVKRQGYSKEIGLLFLRSTDQRLTPEQYIQGWRRGFISDEMLDKKLRELKFPEYEVKQLKKVTEYFPPPQDLIRFAVREVYTPEIVSKYKLTSELPEKFVDEAKKAGLPKEQASNYWASHWELPSVSMGFEMFHRQTDTPDSSVTDDITMPSGAISNNIIGKDTLAQLLKALDVMPWWRDKLIELSYSPLTRVDVRRMYGLGVITEDEVFQNYLDMGYSPKNSKRMTDFTIKYESNEYDGITRASLIDSYADGLLTIEELTLYLTGIGYADKTVQFWVSQAEYTKLANKIKQQSQNLIDKYKMGAITKDDVRNELGTMDVPAQYIEQVIDNVVSAEVEKIKLPSKDDLESWLKNNIIDELYFVQRMRLLGYRDEDILNYLTAITQNFDTDIVNYLDLDIYVRWIKQGIMSAELFVSYLVKMGKSEAEVEEIVASL